MKACFVLGHGYRVLSRIEPRPFLAKLRRYGKPHTPLRRGMERADHPCGWQRCGAEELCDELDSFAAFCQVPHFSDPSLSSYRFLWDACESKD